LRQWLGDWTETALVFHLQDIQRNSDRYIDHLFQQKLKWSLTISCNQKWNEPSAYKRFLILADKLKLWSVENVISYTHTYICYVYTYMKHWFLVSLSVVSTGMGDHLKQHMLWTKSFYSSLVPFNFVTIITVSLAGFLVWNMDLLHSVLLQIIMFSVAVLLVHRSQSWSFCPLSTLVLTVLSFSSRARSALLQHCSPNSLTAHDFPAHAHSSVQGQATCIYSSPPTEKHIESCGFFKSSQAGQRPAQKILECHSRRF
jgi:hypothetical protein